MSKEWVAGASRSYTVSSSAAWSETAASSHTSSFIAVLSLSLVITAGWITTGWITIASMKLQVKVESNHMKTTLVTALILAALAAAQTTPATDAPVDAAKLKTEFDRATKTLQDWPNLSRYRTDN